MKFTPGPLQGIVIIELDPHVDERGFFARTWCKKEFSDQGLPTEFVQSSLSFNKTKGTLRGLHYQKDPHPERKIVQCTRGSIFDVMVDVRPDSETFKKSFSIELNSQNKKIVFIPDGFAHGFQTLEDNSEVFYQISEYFHADLTAGYRWNDPAFSISWPLANPILSERDQALPVLNQ